MPETTDEIQEVASQVPEEAILEAEKEEERIASQSDMAKLYDAVTELTKQIASLKSYTEKKWEETELFRKAGKF